MKHDNPQRGSLAAGPFSLDLETMRLTRDGAPISIGGQPLRILAILLASPGRLVTRESLKEAIWPDSTRIDTERRLNTAMRALRAALGDTAGQRSRIETVRGLGYRWIGREQPAPGPGHPGWLAITVSVTGACLVAGAIAALAILAPGVGEPTQRDRVHFVQIAAGAKQDPGGTYAALSGLIAARPDFRAAQIMRVDIAMRRWREAPSVTRRRVAERTLRQARAAFSSDPDLDVWEAELSLACEWDWAKAERLYRRAISLDGRHGGAREGLSWLLLDAGRGDEALPHFDLLMSQPDLSDARRAQLGWMLLRMKRDALALALCGGGASRNINLLSCQHTALEKTGDVAGARDAAVTLMEIVGAGRAEVAAVRAGGPAQGYQRFLRWRAHGFLPADCPWFERAQVQAGAGEFGSALASLERAFAGREPSIVKLWSTREFFPLRQSPRFLAIWKSVGPRA